VSEVIKEQLTFVSINVCIGLHASMNPSLFQRLKTHKRNLPNLFLATCLDSVPISQGIDRLYLYALRRPSITVTSEMHACT